MMFRQLKVGERLQPFTGTTGQGQAAMLVIAVVDSPDSLSGRMVSIDIFVSRPVSQQLAYGDAFDEQHTGSHVRGRRT